MSTIISRKGNWKDEGEEVNFYTSKGKIFIEEATKMKE